MSTAIPPTPQGRTGAALENYFALSDILRKDLLASSGHATAGLAHLSMPLMSNVNVCIGSKVAFCDWQLSNTFASRCHK